MKDLLNRLFQHETLNEDEAYEVIVQFSKDVFSDFQMASFLTVFNMRPITLAELKGFRKALQDLSISVDLGTNAAIDIVGTGGDGKDTFNISTLASFVVAGSGRKVIKHGNYASSSVSGSSNVLETLGIRFTSDQERLKAQLQNAGICFVHAPLFHPVMKKIAPIRKSLAIKTFFNIMGPLINPAKPKYQMLGTYNAETARMYHFLLQSDKQNYTVVNALDGYDEISLTSPTKVYSPFGEFLLDVEDFSLPKVAQSDIKGGKTNEENGEIFLNILSGKGEESQNAVVIANASLAIKTMQPELELLQCKKEAEESLLKGRALEVWHKYLELS